MSIHKYRKKSIKYLLIFLILFLIAFFIAYLNLKNRKSILNLGFPYEAEDYTVMILSVAGIIKVIYEIITIEHHREFESRVIENMKHKLKH